MADEKQPARSSSANDAGGKAGVSGGAAGGSAASKKTTALSRFDRERFIFRLLAVVILIQLTLYSVATMVCGRVALNNRRQLAEVCPRALDQVAASFDSTLKLLVALLGGAALERGRRP